MVDEITKLLDEVDIPRALVLGRSLGDDCPRCGYSMIDIEVEDYRLWVCMNVNRCKYEVVEVSGELKRRYAEKVGKGSYQGQGQGQGGVRR